MKKQYETKESKIDRKPLTPSTDKMKSRLDRFEAIISQQQSELNFLKREINRLKSDLSQTMSLVRKRD